MPAEPTCPDGPRLQQFLLGQLPLADIEETARHVETCQRCVETLVSLQGRDALVESLAAVATPDDPPVAVIDGLIDRLIGLRPRDPASRPDPVGDQTPPAPTEAVYDFLAPAQGPGEMGRLGPYAVLRVLGTGGMGVVFLAEDTALRRRVALKVMRPILAANAQARRRFVREARAAAGFTHDHVVSVYQVGEDQGVPYLAMPVLQGESLEARLKRDGRLPIPEVLRIGREVATALAAAHDQGLVHRDVKPANVWLETLPDGPRARVKILDFGLARVVETGDDTDSGSVAGTPAYMAPEQARGEPLDGRCDLFSLGCTLYRLCTGRAPFAGANSLATLRSLELDEPPPPAAVSPDVPPALSDLILRLLAKKPDDRPRSARAVVEALAAIERGSPVAPALPRNSWRGRRWWAAAVLLFAIGSLGYWYAPALVRIATNKGELVIEADRDVEITLKQGGQRVRVLDTKANRTFEITPGDYEVEIVEMPDGIRTTTKQFTLTRGGKEVLNVRLELAKAPPVKPGIAPRPKTEPWPIDALRRDKIPEYELAAAGDGGPNQAPAELVAVLGDSRLKHWGDVHSVAFSPDGRVLASGSYDRTVKLWDPVTGRLVRTLSGFPNEVQSVTFRADGAVLASASRDGTVKLWDAATGREVGGFRVRHAARINTIAISPNGATLASAGWDGVSRLWDSATGRELFTLPGGGSGSVHRLAFRPDGRVVASGDNNGDVRVWEVATGQLLRRVTALKGGAYSVAFSPDGKLLAAGHGDGTVCLWDADTWARRRDLVGHQQGVDSVTFRADGRVLASSGADGTVRLWDVATGAALRTLSGHFASVPCVAFRGDTSLLASASLDHSIKVWDTDTGKEASQSSGHCPQVYDLAFHPDGRTMASAGGDEVVTLWDLATAAQLRTLQGHRGPVTSVAYRSDGDVLASGSWDGTVRLWQTGTWKARTLTERLAVASVAFSRDGSLLAYGLANGTVKVLQAAGGAERVALDGHVDWVGTLAFSPDGRVLASGGGTRDRQVKLWEPGTGLELGSLSGHRSGIASVAFRADGRVLASGCDDGTVKLWDVAGRKELRTFKAHEAIVTCVAFAPEGTALATAGQDGTVRMWDSETATVTATFRLAPPGAFVNRVAYSPDGRHLVTANGNGTAYVLRLAPPVK